jgi:hypothetical protein
MRKFFSMLLLICPLAAVAQTQQDYERTMALFMKYYNQGDTSKICQLFRPGFRDDGCGWIGKRVNKYGKIVSQQFVGMDSLSKSENPVRVFKIRYSLAGVKAMSFSLNKNPEADTDPTELPYSFGTFSFIDITPRIEQMVERAR